MTITFHTCSLELCSLHSSAGLWCSTTSWTKWINAAHVIHFSVSGLQLLLRVLSRGREWPPWYVYCTAAFSRQEKQITQQKPFLTFWPLELDIKSDMEFFFYSTQILKSLLATKAHLLTRILFNLEWIKITVSKILVVISSFLYFNSILLHHDSLY